MMQAFNICEPVDAKEDYSSHGSFDHRAHQLGTRTFGKHVP